MKKPTLCVIFGGKSREYEVSLRSVYGILSHISYEKYDVIRLGITKNGEWYIFEGENEEILNDTWHKGKVTPVTIDLSQGHLIAMSKEMYVIDAELFFPVMHGDYVEDGRLQGLFDIAGVRYVGCGAFCSHVCMDKALTKDVARKIGVPVAGDVVLDKNTPIRVDNLSFPVFVKPCMCGSSIGVYRAKCQSELAQGVALALGCSPKVLVEEEIKGDEVEIAVLEHNGGLTVSTVGMIKHKGEFYDYYEKYKSKSTDYYIPAPIGEKTEKYLGECAKKLFFALGCKGLSRFDFFVKENGEVIFNEVNTMPGFTEISMFPRLLMHSGYGYGEIIDILIENALYGNS